MCRSPFSFGLSKIMNKITQSFAPARVLLKAWTSEYFVASRISSHRFRLQYRGCGNFHQVFIKDNKVRFLSRFEAADLLFQAIRLRRPDRHPPYRLFPCQRILRLKSSGRISLCIHAEHRCQKSLERTYILHREIRTQWYPSVLLQQLLKSIGAFYSHRTQPLTRPVHIAGGMRGLYRRDNRSLSEQAKISGIYHLRMFDTPALIIFTL